MSSHPFPILSTVEPIESQLEPGKTKQIVPHYTALVPQGRIPAIIAQAMPPANIPSSGMYVLRTYTMAASDVDWLVDDYYSVYFHLSACIINTSFLLANLHTVGERASEQTRH